MYQSATENTSFPKFYIMDKKKNSQSLCDHKTSINNADVPQLLLTFLLLIAGYRIKLMKIKKYIFFA